MQANKAIRAALHAGSWYTQNSKKLDQELSKYLSEAQLIQNSQKYICKALIGPHSGLKYGGPTAAHGYKYFQKTYADKNNQNIRVFLFGPSHYTLLKGVSFSNCAQLETPLENLNVDQQLISRLKGQITQNVDFPRNRQQQQHSLQMHLPFIKKVFGNAQVIPVIVGELSQQQIQAYGEILAPYFNDENSIFIISSDFCHWGSHFDYRPFKAAGINIHEQIKKQDKQGIDLIKNHKLKQFTQYIAQTGNTICGETPIRLLLSTIKHSRLSLTTKQVHYSQSDQVKSASQSSVSYASLITYIQA